MACFDKWVLAARRSENQKNMLFPMRKNEEKYLKKVKQSTWLSARATVWVEACTRHLQRKCFIFRKMWALWFFPCVCLFWLDTSISPISHFESWRLKIILRDHLNHHFQRLNWLLDYSEMKPTRFKVPSPRVGPHTSDQGVHSEGEMDSHVLTHLLFLLCSVPSHWPC